MFISRFIWYFTCISWSFAANILYLEAIPSPSHHIWNRKLALALESKGHNITMIGPDTEKIKKDNFTHILMEGVYTKLFEGANGENNENIMDFTKLSTYTLLNIVKVSMINACWAMYESKGMKIILDYPDYFKFDLIIVDVSIGECLHPLIKKFNYPPTVGVSIWLLPAPVAFKFGNPIQPSFMPSPNIVQSTTMNFMERVFNFLVTYLDVYTFGKGDLNEEMSLKKFGLGKEEMNNLTRHISLVLANSDPILSFPHALAPHIINVGGLHLDKPEPLPQEYEKILNSAKDGAIVFSLGTNIKSKDIDPNRLKMLLEAFKKLPYIVLWKFEDELKDKPKNVIIKKWLPQGPLLAHPNVKLFIGHGGSLSTQEAIYHGVPIIALPFWLDQGVNAKIVEEKGIARILDIKTLTTEKVIAVIQDIIKNQKYKNKAMELSQSFKDRLNTPLETAIFWIEFVLRHNGAPFLSSKSRDLPFFVQSSLDVVLFLVVILVVFFIVSYKLLYFLLSCVKWSRVKNKEKKL